MAGAPVGQRIRKRRQELGRSQTGLAKSVGISPSYLNLIEHNKRSIGGALLNRIAKAISLDSRALAGTEESRLIAELIEVAADTSLVGLGLTPQDAAEFVASSPRAARAILTLYRDYREARMRSDLIGERLGEDSFLAEASHQILTLITTIRSYAEILEDYGDIGDAQRSRFIATLVGEAEALAGRASDMFDFMSGRGRGRPRPSPREAIEDFFSDRANYFPRLEMAAEETRDELPRRFGPTVETLTEHLRKRHAITVERAADAETGIAGERLRKGEFSLSDLLSAESVRFRLARLVAMLEHGETLDILVEDAALSSGDAAARLRRALASYFAAALLMPYRTFRQSAEDLRYDLLLLGNRFGASFEQVCHRLATLRRPGAEGVPLHFLRTDIAGNISKRFSASGLRLPRYGGACPRWVVHRAFATPGRLVTQVCRLPDEESYLCVARADLSSRGDAPRHAVMIGAAISYASRFACADGIDLSTVHFVPVGVTCRQCSRDDCSDRAFERAPVFQLDSSPGDTTPG